MSPVFNNAAARRGKSTSRLPPLVAPRSVGGDSAGGEAFDDQDDWDEDEDFQPDADDPRWSEQFGADFEEDEPDPEPGDFWMDEEEDV